jgi:hypothetical protein
MSQEAISVVEQLKSRLLAKLAKPVDLAEYKGDEWWQLHPAEAYVFGLDRADLPALIDAWEFYEGIIGTTDNDFADDPLCAKARVALPSIIVPWESDPHQPEQWIKFAGLLGIRGRTANAWFHKFLFTLDREGVMIWSDDDMPMPRAVELPKPTHATATDTKPHETDDDYPF